MKNLLIHIRNIKIKIIYKYILRPVFFRNNPEKVHDFIIKIGSRVGAISLVNNITSLFLDYSNTILNQNILGINFANPIGLAAGFDKNAELTEILPSIGFGHIEVGSITGEKCEGNPKPRLWRLPKSKSLVVYYGLKNDGCISISKRLLDKKFDIPVGISVAMTNCEDNSIAENGIADFAKAFIVMEPFGDYLTVNISCPNTKSGQPFLDPNNFDNLFKVLDTIPTQKPIFIKLSPDIDFILIDTILGLASKHRIKGVITTNLTKNRDNTRIIDQNVPKQGGLSGKVVQGLSDDMLAYVYKKFGNKFVIIGSGGIFTAEDAYKKIRLGASLVQLITGMIYEGPQLISEINRGLVVLLRKDGYTNISQAIGVDNVKI